MITHLVLFRFKPGFTADAAEVKSVHAAMAGLPREIGTIREWRHGFNVTPDAEAWDYGLFASFDDEQALYGYFDHPAHLAVSGTVFLDRGGSRWPMWAVQRGVTRKPRVVPLATSATKLGVHIGQPVGLAINSRQLGVTAPSKGTTLASSPRLDLPRIYRKRDPRGPEKQSLTQWNAVAELRFVDLAPPMR